MRKCKLDSLRVRSVAASFSVPTTGKEYFLKQVEVLLLSYIWGYAVEVESLKPVGFIW